MLYIRNSVGKNAISNIVEALLAGSLLENYGKNSQITV